jgi:hypothetical protein
MEVLMTTRSLFSAFVLGISTIAIVPAATVRAEDAQAQEIENSKFQAIGSINSNAVYIRSGPSENDYPTLKLDRGGQVTAVGIRGDWLKIIPPEGSYCYVAKAYVEKRGDGTVGRVTNPLNVRVGSALNAMKTKVAAKLDNGDDVKIVGEQDEYFKISPPKDVYLYVNKQFVDLVSTAKAGSTPAPAQGNTAQAPAPTPTDAQAGNTQTPVQIPTATPAPTNDQTATATPIAPNNTTQAPTDQTQAPAPTDESAKAPTAGASDSDQASAAPTTKPADAEADAETQFDQLEKTFIDNDKKSIDQQPLTELQAGYQKLTANPALPESLHRMCDYRLATLKDRVEDQQRYLAVKKSQDEMKAKQLALQAEREELETRIKNSGVKYYTAVGTLRVSSLQQGGGTLYRLTDPKTGRTVIYVRSDDAKIGSEIGQFIGIQGNVSDEQSFNLKVITPTSFEEVDQSKVNVSVAAQIVPPSMMPTGTASTGNE